MRFEIGLSFKKARTVCVSWWSPAPWEIDNRRVLATSAVRSPRKGLDTRKRLWEAISALYVQLSPVSASRTHQAQVPTDPVRCPA